MIVATLLFTTPVFRLGGAGIASERARCVAKLWFALRNGTELRDPFKKAGYCVAQANTHDNNKSVAD